MARIEDAVFQDEVATSLLGPEAEQAEQEPGYFAGDSVELLNEAINEEQNDPVRLGDEEMEARQPSQPQREEQEQREPRETHETEQEQPEQAYVPPSAEQVEEGIARLDATVKQYGLNDEATRRELAEGFCQSLGTTLDRADMNIEAFGNVAAKTMLSTNVIYDAVGGDLSKLPPIPEHSARVWLHEFLTSCNMDPRTSSADPLYAARTVQGALFSVLNTLDALGGKVADVRRINSPELSEFYYGHFIKAFSGIEPPQNKTPEYRALALKWADAFADYAIKHRLKYQQLQDNQRNEASSQQRRTTTRGQRVPAKFREGVKGSKAPKFSTNKDIFDDGTMQHYHQQHGRL